MSIQYHYNRTGAERKELVKTVAKILGEPAVYCKAPTFAYRIGFCHIDKGGILSCPEDTAPEKVSQLIENLREQGYIPAETTTNSAESANVERLTHPFTIAVPSTGFSEVAYANLQKIIASKEGLLRKALGVECLSPIQVTDEKILFPWFTLHGLDGEADAYTRLVSAICKMAARQKRVTAKSGSIENEKFSMRLFLIRLGFIGDEFKPARKLLLRNLIGNSSWKSGRDPRQAAKEAALPDAPQYIGVPAEESPDPLSDSGSGEPPAIPPVQNVMKQPGGEPDEE